MFECDTQQLEETISVLGQLVERDVSIPNYPPCILEYQLGRKEQVWENFIVLME